MLRNSTVRDPSRQIPRHPERSKSCSATRAQSKDLVGNGSSKRPVPPPCQILLATARTAGGSTTSAVRSPLRMTETEPPHSPLFSLFILHSSFFTLTKNTPPFPRECDLLYRNFGENLHVLRPEGAELPTSSLGEKRKFNQNYTL